MQVLSQEIKGVFEVRPKVIGDSRGFFSETYRSDAFEEHGIGSNWVQENQSLSTRLHTLRGLHFQVPPKAQAKLVSVARGRILDVFVDLRKDSETYGKWGSVELDWQLCNRVFVPRGFAHGFCTLTDEVIVQYKVDEYYAPDFEQAFMWNDPVIGVEWPVGEPFLSDRDKSHPAFEDFETPFEV